jgi:hypothetical protein
MTPQSPEEQVRILTLAEETISLAAGASDADAFEEACDVWRNHEHEYGWKTRLEAMCRFFYMFGQMRDKERLQVQVDAYSDAVLAYAGIVSDMTQGDAVFPTEYADEIAEIEDALARAQAVQA